MPNDLRALGVADGTIELVICTLLRTKINQNISSVSAVPGSELALKPVSIEIVRLTQHNKMQ